MKRVFASIGIFLACAFLVLAMLVCVARSSKVQTAAVGVLAEQLSRGLGTRIEVAQLHYAFPNQLLVRGVYLEDQYADTLLYVDTLSARFDVMALADDRISFRSVSLHGVSASAHRVPTNQETDSVMNYQFLLDAFRQEQKEDKGPLLIAIEVKNVSLDRVRMQYNGWHIEDAKAHVALNALSADSLDAQIYDLSLKLSKDAELRYVKGHTFELEDLAAHLVMTDRFVEMPTLRLRTTHSDFEASTLRVELAYEEAEDGQRQLDWDQTRLAFRIDHLLLQPRDMAVFVPALHHADGLYSMTADLSGQLDSLQAEDLSLSYNGRRIIRANVTALGLPNLDSAYLRAECEDLYINKAIVQDIVSDFTNRPYQLPVLVERLGATHYRGTLEGRLEQMTLHGAFQTALGSLTTNGLFKTNSQFDTFGFVGEVSTRRFELGRLLDNKDMGLVALSVRTDGHVAKDHPFHGTAKADVASLEYRGYAYQQMHLNGQFQNNKFVGRIGMDDPNLDFTFDGLVDLSQSVPFVDFDLALRHLRLGELHLSNKYRDSDLSLDACVMLKGKQLDDMVADVHISDIIFRNKAEQVTVSHFDVAAQPNQLSIQSSLLTAVAGGDYRYSTLPYTIKRFIAHYIPRAISEKDRRALQTIPADNNLEMSIYLKDLTQLCKTMEWPVSVASLATVKGHIDEGANQFALQAIVPDLSTSAQHFEDLSLSIDNRLDRLNLAFYVYKHRNEQVYADQHVGDIRFYVNAFAEADSLMVSLDWQNPDTMHNAGSVQIGTHFSQYAGYPLVSAHIYPSQIILQDSVWDLGNAYLTYTAADTSLQVQNFYFGSMTQYLAANGVASPREEDAISVQLRDINLDYVLGYTQVNRSITFGGNISGWATAYGLFTQPMFEAQVSMPHAAINHCEIGDVQASAHFVPETKAVVIEGHVHEAFPDADSLSLRRVAHVDGLVQGGHWHLDIEADSVRLGFINYWTDSFLADIDGRATGHVEVGGKKGETFVTCRAMAHNAHVTIPFTGGTYYLSDSIFMDTTALRFEQIQLRDIEGNRLMLDGTVTHNGMFQDLAYDLTVHADKAICLNLPETGYYGGKVYGTGDVHIHGDVYDCAIQARARTEAGSTFACSISNASSASETGFVRFVDHKASSQQVSTEQKPVTGSHISLSLQIEATPDAQARLILDDRTGDQLKGRGAGNLQIDLVDDDVTMRGQYVLESGTFGFTFQNVIRREFQIAEGSSVTWSGVIDEPVVDVRALYRLTASLRDLFGTDASQLSTNRSSVPVNCVLNLSDQIMNPTIHFGIELPQSDESVSSQVRSVINTEEMLTRQVLYLLVFNRFYTPEYLQNTQNIGISETYSLLSSTVTGQINNWLGKLTDAVTLGFNVRADGLGQDGSQEYEAQFELHPLSGLVINGNLGYRYNDIANQPFFGNLDLEYMLTPNGKLRAKAYTHTVDKYSLRQANTVQGVGLIFKHDF